MALNVYDVIKIKSFSSLSQIKKEKNFLGRKLTTLARVYVYILDCG